MGRNFDDRSFWHSFSKHSSRSIGGGWNENHENHQRGPRITWNSTVRGRWITVESWVAGSKNEGDRSRRRRSKEFGALTGGAVGGLDRVIQRKVSCPYFVRHARTNPMRNICTRVPPRLHAPVTTAFVALILPFRFAYTLSYEFVHLHPEDIDNDSGIDTLLSREIDKV